jgi:hypothetical protein
MFMACIMSEVLHVIILNIIYNSSFP